MPMTNIGVPSGLRASSCHSSRKHQASAEPSSEPKKPTMPPCSRKMRSICACVAPMARRMPISLPRWMTDTTSTLAMPKATESATKKRMTLLDTRCAVSAVTNWALVLIQLSAVSPVSPAMRLGQAFGQIEVAQREVDAGDAADQIEQALRGAQADVDVARIDALVAEVEQAGDGQRVAAPVGGAQAQLVADLGAEILGQFDADHRLAGADPQLAGGQPLGQRDDADVAFRLDADHGNRLVGFAAHGEGRAGGDRRDGGDFRPGFQAVAQRLPLVDGAQALGLLLQAQGGGIGGLLRAGDFLGRQQRDVRLRATACA